MSIRLKQKIGRRVLRYFGIVEDPPSKASVEPVSRTDDLGRLMSAPVPNTKALFNIEAIAEHMRAAGPPPQHPLAPEREPPPLDWDRWSTMQRQTFRRGWSFARYAVKSPPPENRMACVFGIVRGAWGICTMNFYVCGNGYDVLNAITHLPSGMGCGLFTDQESAATACEIAERLSDDWEALDPYADGAGTTEAIRRLQSAWTAAGLTKCATHAHSTADTNTSPIPIWFQDYSTMIMGRPEKLS